MNFRERLVIFTTLTFVVLITLSSWYINFDHEEVDNIKEEIYLTHSEAKDKAVYYRPSMQYYYKIEYVKLKKKTSIPFIYHTEVISDVKKQLMEKSR